MACSVCSCVQTPTTDVLAWMSDCVAANLASYRDSLQGPFPYSEHNGCLPHTGSHVGEHMETPHVDEFMILYNACVGFSNYAKVPSCDVTGNVAMRKSATRWFSSFDVQELSFLPNSRNGKLLAWVDRMAEQGICEKTCPKMRKFLLHPRKLKLFQLELMVVGHIGKGLKARNTSLEGDTFEILHCYDIIQHMGEALKSPMTPELKADVVSLATDSPAAPSTYQRAASAASAPAPTLVPTPADALQVLESLPPCVFKTVNVSVDHGFWEWSDGVIPQPRFVGKPTSWKAKDDKTAIRIKWEVGRTPEGEPVLDAAGKTKYEPTAEAVCSKLVQHGLRLEPFDDGAAPPTLFVPEVPEAQVPDTHLLSSDNMSDPNVLLALARAVVSPAAQYCHEAMDGKRGAQLARAKAVRFFDPRHVMARTSDVSEEDVDGLSIFRMHKHSKIAPKIEVRSPR